MEYSEFVKVLLNRGFTRVERDDRLLDVFPAEEREKGIELWEKWATDDVRIIRVRLPYYEKKAKMFKLSKAEMQTLLLENKRGELDKYPILAENEGILN